MIELYPAIDLIGSTSVRLTEGKYDSEEKCRVRLKKVLLTIVNLNVNRIHIVDLIGAKAQYARV